MVEMRTLHEIIRIAIDRLLSTDRERESLQRTRAYFESTLLFEWFYFPFARSARERHKVVRVAGPGKSLIRLYVLQSAQQKSEPMSHERSRHRSKLRRDGEEDDTRWDGETERARANEHWAER